MQTRERAVVLGSAQVEAIPEVALAGVPGVANRVLWHDGTSMAGVLRVPAGVHLGAHTHRANHHHFWVLEGSAEVLGAVVGPGSYVHVPSGVEHDIDARATDGCLVHYLYVRQTPADWSAEGGW